jgi:hypothetical protein
LAVTVNVMFTGFSAGTISPRPADAVAFLSVVRFASSEVLRALPVLLVPPDLPGAAQPAARLPRGPQEPLQWFSSGPGV